MSFSYQMLVKMKKLFVFICSFLLLLTAGYLLVAYFLVVRPMRIQQDKGEDFIKSLTKNDLENFIPWIDGLLISGSDVQEVSDGDVPKSLSDGGALRVVRIPPNIVVISWLGGLDHTELIFEKENEHGSYTVRAVYSDENQEVLFEDLKKNDGDNESASGRILSEERVKQKKVHPRMP